MIPRLRHFISSRLMVAVLGTGILAGGSAIAVGFIIIEGIVGQAAEASFYDTENRFALLDSELARIEVETSARGKVALAELARRFPTIAAATAAGEEGLDDAAAELGVSEIYFIAKDGTVEATSLGPDLGLDLFSIGQRFKAFLNDLFDSGRFAGQRLSMSTKGGEANNYQYYGPKGADYLLEVSTRLDDSIQKAYPGMSFSGLFRRIFNSDGAGAHPLVQAVDFIWGYKPPYRSLVDGLEVDAELGRLIEQAKADGVAAYRRAGSKATYVRAIQLSKRGFDYVDTSIYAVIAADRSSAKKYAAFSMTVAGGFLALSIALSYALVKRSFQRHISARLESLQASMERVGSGDAEAILDDGGQDEIASIGHSAEGMVEDIRERNAELSTVARRLEEEIDAEKLRELSLSTALEANQALIHEVNHRVKNNLQFAMSLAAFQSSAADGPEARSALERLQARLQVMAMVQDQALRRPGNPLVDMGTFIEDIAADVAAEHPRLEAKVERRIEAGGIELDHDKAVWLGLAAAELIDNAFRHAFKDADGGRLSVTFRQAWPGRLSLEVTDDGTGTPRTGGVGLMITAALASQLGGKLSWESGSGTSVTITLPT